MLLGARDQLPGLGLDACSAREGVYADTAGLVWAPGKEKKVLSQTDVGATLYASQVVANGTHYMASKGGWLWAVRQVGR
jgi:hypothetical protein